MCGVLLISGALALCKDCASLMHLLLSTSCILPARFNHLPHSSLYVQSKDAAVKAMVGRCIDIPLSQRKLCAARLITLADVLDKKQQLHQHGARHTARRQEQQAVYPQKLQPQLYLSGMAAFVTMLLQSGAAQLATAADGQEGAAETAESMAAILHQTLQRLQARLAAGGAIPSVEQQRLHALAHLLCLLLLHALADPVSADPALAGDLDRVSSMAVGRSALQRQQQLQNETAVSSVEGDSESVEGDSESDGEDAGDDEQPHWHDTLMDVLLSLLARNATPLPSAPLRDAVEHVFRAFADNLTATGGCLQAVPWMMPLAACLAVR